MRLFAPLGLSAPARARLRRSRSEARTWHWYDTPIRDRASPLVADLVYTGFSRRGRPDDEPSMIDLRLCADFNRAAPPDQPPDALHYARMSAVCRGSYLRWLAGGRCHPAIHGDYVVLFLCGVERRVLCEPLDDFERRLLWRALRDLCECYGDRTGLRGLLDDLLGVLELARTGEWFDACAQHLRPGRPGAGRYGLTPVDRIRLGRLLASGAALPLEWALRIAERDPALPRAQRGANDPTTFASDFSREYLARFPDGLVLPYADTRYCLHYAPINPHFHGQRIELRAPDPVPDVLGADPAFRSQLLAHLAAVIAPAAPVNHSAHWRDVWPDLSRACRTGAPPRRLDHFPELQPLRDWLHTTLARRTAVCLTLAEVLDRFPRLSARQRYNRTRAETVSLVLACLGVGMCPDVHLDGVVVKPHQDIHLFTLHAAVAATPTPAYRRLSLLIRLSSQHRTTLSVVWFTHACAWQGVLDADERVRLSALSQWLRAHPSRQRLLRGLSASERHVANLWLDLDPTQQLDALQTLLDQVGSPDFTTRACTCLDTLRNNNEVHSA